MRYLYTFLLPIADSQLRRRFEQLCESIVTPESAALPARGFVYRDSPGFQECIELASSAGLAPIGPKAQWSNEEILAARWSIFFPIGIMDALRPKSWFERSFDRSDYCEQCGIGGFQVGPVGLGKIPRGHKWLAFHSTFYTDIVFLSAARLGGLVQRHGIPVWPVLKGGSPDAFDDVWQLREDRLIEVRSTASSGQTIFCPKCGRVKYNDSVGDMLFEIDASPDEFHLGFTSVWFGANYPRAFRFPIVSRQAMNEFIGLGLPLSSFRPICL